MWCENCKKFISDEDIYCRHCGTKVQKNKKKGFFFFLIIGLLFPIVGLILFIIYHKKNNNSYVGLISGGVSFLSSIFIIIALISRYYDIYNKMMGSTIVFKNNNIYYSETRVYNQKLEIDEYIINNEGDYNLIEEIKVDDTIMDDYYDVHQKVNYTITYEYTGIFEMVSDNELLLKIENYRINIEINNNINDQFISYFKECELYGLTEEQKNELMNNYSLEIHKSKVELWDVEVYFDSMSFNLSKYHIEDLM